MESAAERNGDGKKLVTLPVVIFDQWKRIVRIVDLPDPRDKYVSEYNQRCKARGLTAKVG